MASAGKARLQAILATAAAEFTGTASARAACSGAVQSQRRLFSISLSSLGAIRPTLPVMQKGGAAKGGKGGGPAAAAVVETFDLKKQIPVNILKEGPEPEYQSDDKYPPWLFKLLEDKPPAEDIMMKGIENMTREDMKMIIRAASKKRIKEHNMVTAKGGDE